MFGSNSMIVLQLIIMLIGIVRNVFISSLCLSCWAFWKALEVDNDVFCLVLKKSFPVNFEFLFNVANQVHDLWRALCKI
jgi:hypothetical protein